MAYENLDKLCSAVQSARKSMQWAREQMRESVRQTAGSRWSEEASRETIHVNFLSLYQKIAIRALIANDPRVMLATFSKDHKPAVNAMQEWRNRNIVDTHAKEAYQRVVQSALHGIGIMKIGIADPPRAANRSWASEVGEVFMEPIDFDDWVWDHHARHISECKFMGHRFRVPLESIKDSKRYGKQRKDLTASEDPHHNEDGDERLNVLGRGYQGEDTEIEDMIDLWEIYLPQKQCIITIPHDSITGITAPSHGGRPVALLEQDWIGPESGPYEILGLEWVVGNLMPKGPMQDLIDLHIPLNQMMRKLLRQARRMKELTFFRKGSDGDEKRVRESDDGDTVPVDNPKDIQTIMMGGPNQMLFQFFMQMKEIFSWFAGNLDIMGGLSPQAKTASQDAMLNENSARGIQDMQARTISFVSACELKACWWHYHHPTKVMESSFSPPGLQDVSIQRKLKPWNAPEEYDQSLGVVQPLRRDLEWDKIDLRVDPYSLAHTTPQQRANDLTQIVTQLYVPLSQMFMQQGISISLPKLLELLAKYKDMPDLSEIIQYAEAPMEQGMEEPQQGAPEETVHIRENRSERTNQGNNLNLINSLAGVDGGGASNGQMQ